MIVTTSHPTKARAGAEDSLPRRSGFSVPFSIRLEQQASFTLHLSHKTYPIKAALARDPGQTMMDIAAFNIAASEGRGRGNARHVRADQGKPQEPEHSYLSG